MIVFWLERLRDFFVLRGCVIFFCPERLRYFLSGEVAWFLFVPKGPWFFCPERLRIPKFPSSKVSMSPGSQVLKFPRSQVLKFPSSQVPKSPSSLILISKHVYVVLNILYSIDLLYREYMFYAKYVSKPQSLIVKYWQVLDFLLYFFQLSSLDISR